MKPLRQEFCRAALTLIGTPYEYGGRISVPGHYGTDCWGLVADAMHLAGDRETAAKFARWWAQKGFDELPSFESDRLSPGDLLFYGESPTHITHVTIHLGGLVFVRNDTREMGPHAFDLREDHLLSASGGGPTVKTPEEAFRRNARVKLFRHANYQRKDFVAARSMHEYLY